jgi:hypothetical protein
MLLHTLLPAYDFCERHSTTVRSDVTQLYRMLREITPAELPLFRRLMALRGLPGLLTGQRGGRHFDLAIPLLSQVVGRAFVVVGDVPNHELVLGTIGQFWKPLGGESCTFNSSREFQAFNEPGFAKAAINFVLEQEGERRCRVSTETRVRCTDAAARRKFLFYWFVIRAGSGLIRREFLRALRRRAERAQPSPTEAA